jgi:hypothetical protein
VPMFAYVRHFKCLGAEGLECKHSRGRGEKAASHPGPEAALMLKTAGPGSAIDHLINRKAVFSRKIASRGEKMSTKIPAAEAVAYGNLRRISSLSNYYPRAFARSQDHVQNAC